jgi:hypothetical protein
VGAWQRLPGYRRVGRVKLIRQPLLLVHLSDNAVKRRQIGGYHWNLRALGIGRCLTQIAVLLV